MAIQSHGGNVQFSAASKSSLDDAHAAAPDVDLAFVDAVQIALPAELELAVPDSRPVIVVDDGTALTNELARQLSVLRSVVVLSPVAGASEGLPASIPRVTFSNYSEKELQSVLRNIESRFGVPSGFLFQFNDSETDMEQLGWALMAAKHLSAALRTPVDGGRAFFVCVARMDGKLGITSGQNNVPGSVEDVLSAQRGAAFGLCKTLDLEWPHVFCRGVDVAKDLVAAKAASLLIKELSCPNLTLRETGYCRLGNRWTSVSRPLFDSPDSPVGPGSKADFTKDDVLLVTGGARGITPICIAELAKRVGGGTFFLLGRSNLIEEPSWAHRKEGKELEKAGMDELKSAWKAGKGSKPTPTEHKKLIDRINGSREVLDSLDVIKRAGGTAHYFACDVGDRASVEVVLEKIRTSFGLAVTGLFHAAGVLRDKLVEKKALSDFKMVYGVKVQGLEILLQSLGTQVDTLRHLVVFSSLAGFHGNMGQSDYAMANDALSKMVHRFSQAHPSCRGRALCFGPWDGGMVTPALKARFQAMGVQIIPRKGGAKQVAALLTLPGPGRAQCLVGNWGLPPVAPLATHLTVKATHLSPSSGHNEWLLDHAIQGNPTLPMTVAIGYLGKVTAQLHPGWHLSCLEECKFFNGVPFAADQECEVRMMRQDHDTSGSELRVQATLFKQNNKKMMPTFQAIVVLSRKGPAQPPSFDGKESLTKQDGSQLSGAEMYDNVTLFHGPKFQGFERTLNVDGESCTMVTNKMPVELSLEHQAGQGHFALGNFSLDYFTADLCYQAALVWVRKNFGMASLPNFAAKYQQFKTIQFGQSYFSTLVMEEGTGATRTGDWYLYDANGVVHAKATGIRITMSPTLKWTK